MINKGASMIYITEQENTYKRQHVQEDIYTAKETHIKENYGQDL